MSIQLITNFPANYPLYKKIAVNCLYLPTGIVIQKRKNLLTKRDIIKARVRLRKGDIILVGNLHELSSMIIGGPFTHSLLYIGRKRLIEAVAFGVRYTTLHHIFTSYDTLAILRLPKGTKRKKHFIRHAIGFAKAQIGKAYDWDFTQTKKGFFCSKLVNEAFRAAGYKTKLASTAQPRSFFVKLLHKITRSITALRPSRFTYGNFEIVLLSHNLTMKGKKIVLKNE